ncbi:MAG: TIGR00153 family protein [Pseudomonadales bacterium]|jgi:hypothetical protein|nr:TIGR00153 family protein [Pseudomonadales bacterium]MDP6472725.1 TIGR00153 family protein [Pseudomonadales bacterium]MDP6827938.1 TIGR00153 family protein [Pseudomonadales bacterium]MDP6973101.1 TIGR00153 family protein [Pseudomonadales bacterium]|tara:strand:- start:231 stop:908 length:678 start_codon:yes stop_codon:yes gene_type:complete
MTSTYVARIFGRSPFGPIQDHIDVCYRCATLTIPVLEAVAKNDWNEVARMQEEITVLENEADVMKTRIRENLPLGFFLPVSRPDLLELLTRQDRIANRAKGIVGLIVGRRLAFPESITPGVTELAHACISACGLARDVVHRLDELLEAGFSGRETDKVRNLVRGIDDRERQCDEMEAKLRGKLFRLEAELAPVDVMFMYRVIEWIGDLANHAEQVGHRLDQLLAN